MIKRYVTTASMVCTMALGLSGSAFASEATISTTGNESTNKIMINNSSKTEVENTNDVHVLNINAQSAKSGSVEASKNTSIEGSVGSGNASNNNSVKTDVNISNGGGTTVTPGSGNGGNGGGTTVTPGGGKGSGTTSAAPGKGSVRGASTTAFGSGAGAGVLPEVGAQFPVDVSAMRAAWGQQAAPKTLAKNSALFTNFMLMTAALMSLLGAAGSFWYAKRREERI